MASLRFRLILIVFLAILPMAGLIIYGNLEQRQLATLDSQKDLLRVVQNCVSDYTHTILQTKQLLAALTVFPAVIQQDPQASSELFARVLKADSLYINILATKLDGEVFASAHPLPPQHPYNLADRLYFQRSLKTGQFSVGELVIARTMGVATLPCGYPVFGQSGQFQGVVTAGLNLDRLGQIFQVKDLPAGVCIAIIDNRGRIMFRHPEPENWIGKDFSHAEIIRITLAQKQGFVKARGPDGVARLYAFLPLGGTSPEGFVLSGVPPHTIYAPLRNRLIRNLSSLGLVTIIVLILAWLFGYLFVIRRMDVLTKATKQLAAGDLNARTGMDYGKGEIDLLGHAFDEMASTLQQRELERRQSESELRRGEEKYRLLVKQIPAVVYKGYLDWSLECFDEKIEEITGYSQEDFNSRRLTWRDLIFPEDKEQAKELFREALKTQTFYVTEHRIKTKTGEIRWIQARNRIHLDDHGKSDYISGVFFDITERKKLEEQLVQAQKMEAIGILAGGMAHDFNNLLTAIMGYSQIMMMDLTPDSPHYHGAEEIMRAAEHGASLTNKLLAFSRKQILNPRVIDLNAIVTDMDKMLRRLIGEDVDLITRIDADLGLVKADPSQIEQIIMNLSVNARDAMPQGGKMIIETANASLDEAYAQSHAGVSPGPYVMLAVTDSGMGMDAETVAHIFEPFFTTKESGKGTGLGLPMIYGIVKQSGGHIWLYSEPGQGTTFKIYFPRVEEGIHPAAPLPAAPLDDSLLRGEETILLVEDEAVLRELISRALEKFGYQVRMAANAGEALDICEKEKGPLHLVLTDVVLPQISGTELAERLTALRPGLKVIYMSGYTTNAIVHRGVLDAGINFLQKPVKVLHLVQKVREVLDAGAVSEN
jgi:PAS domain S-box-containing protein